MQAEKFIMIVYRIISFFVNVFCAFAAFSLFFLIFVALSQPAAFLQVFIMLAVALYGWFSRMFFKRVVLEQQQMTRRQKDWLQANAIVAAIFALMGITNGIIIYRDPQAFLDLLKSLPIQNPSTGSAILSAAYMLSGLCLLLLIHVIWTYILVRKHQQYFTSEDS